MSPSIYRRIDATSGAPSILHLSARKMTCEPESETGTMDALSSICRLLSRSPAGHSISTDCPGSKVNDYLTIDCSACDGPQDLGQLRCLRGCVRAISYAGEVDHIALSRDVVVEYRGRSVAALKKMSAPLTKSRIGRRTVSKRCSRCPIEPFLLVDLLCSKWPPMPPPESFVVPTHRDGGARCVACRNRTILSMEAMRKDLAAANIQLNHLTVRVLGGRN